MDVPAHWPIAEATCQMICAVGWCSASDCCWCGALEQTRSTKMFQMIVCRVLECLRLWCAVCWNYALNSCNVGSWSRWNARKGVQMLRHPGCFAAFHCWSAILQVKCESWSKYVVFRLWCLFFCLRWSCHVADKMWNRLLCHCLNILLLMAGSVRAETGNNENLSLFFLFCLQGPIMLEMGIPPPVVSSTAAYMLLFTTFSTTIQVRIRFCRYTTVQIRIRI